MKKFLNYQVFIIFWALFSFFSTLVYYFWALSAAGLLFSLLLTGLVTGYLASYTDNFPSNPEKKQISWPEAVYFLLWLGAIVILWRSRTEAAITSPWEAVPAYFFLAYFLASAWLIINWRVLRLRSWWLSLHFFLSFSIAAIVYQLSYGFDPFIHRASIRYILEHGFIAPKTFYYIGQYAPVLLLTKFFHLSLLWTDKLLVPLLAAVSLPLVFCRTRLRRLNQESGRLLFLLAALGFTFSFFIITVPQNLAYLCLLLVVILNLADDSAGVRLTMAALSLAAASAQPIAGLPAIFFVAAKFCQARFGRRAWLRIGWLILTAATVPAALYLVEKGYAPLDAGMMKAAFREFLDGLRPAWPRIPNTENIFLNGAYLWGFNLWLFYALFAAAGVGIWRRQERAALAWQPFLDFAGAMGLAFLLSKFLPFSYLIDYEKSNYSDRILLIAAFFLWPFALLAWDRLLRRILVQPWPARLIFAIAGAALLTVSLYFSFPRRDNLFNSHGLSTSGWDVAAAQWIDAEAGGADYVVLANQQVSAAALSQFGFKRYYKDLFFYPIPTGARTYELFLEMSERPDREIMLKAMDLAGVDRAFFVLNRYWWAAAKLADEARLSADGVKVFGDNEVYVFAYRR